jgi:hypothetical protein
MRIVMRDAAGDPWCDLLITDRPRQRANEGSAAAATLREASTYIYRVEASGDARVQIEPTELFDPDDDSGLSGRLRTGQSVGRMPIVIMDHATGKEFHAFVDVEPAKLDQATEYQQMLIDISDHAVEAILQGFAPTTLELTLGDAAAELLYQRFALMNAYIRDGTLEGAVGRVVGQPQRAWRVVQERQPASRAFPAGSAFGRALRMPGPRTGWPAAGGLTWITLPRYLSRERHEATVDTAANRFVRFLLERWRELTLELLSLLGGEGDVRTGPSRRGRLAAERALETLDELLAHSLFREIGPLTALPLSDQMLHKGAGYGELLRMFAAVELAPALRFTHPETDDVYDASLRNVATLYEFWCYLVLVDAVGSVCGCNKTANAFTVAGDGLSVTLRAGRFSEIRWRVSRQGRELDVSLFFNRHFPARGGNHPTNGSWSRAMRPDCSVHVRPVSALPAAAAPGDLDVWLHFDAKYRTENLLQQFTVQIEDDEALAADEAERVESLERSKREDLLKMHAYRDAIFRTAGAYVLFPGDTPLLRCEYRELLPGLGAFPLRPAAGGFAVGTNYLVRFLSDVLDHVSEQASRHERGRFWAAAVNSPRGVLAAPSAPVSFLDRPPADTAVLIGFIRDIRHWQWIDKTRSYNLRGDDRAGAVQLGSRELGADLVLLYERVRDALLVVDLARIRHWRAVTRDDLMQSGYPEPRGRLYFVAALEPIIGKPAWLGRVDVAALRPSGQPFGAPFVVTWWDLLNACP